MIVIYHPEPTSIVLDVLSNMYSVFHPEPISACNLMVRLSIPIPCEQINKDVVLAQPLPQALSSTRFTIETVTSSALFPRTTHSRSLVVNPCHPGCLAPSLHSFSKSLKPNIQFTKPNPSPWMEGEFGIRTSALATLDDMSLPTSAGLTSTLISYSSTTKVRCVISIPWNLE